MIEVKKFVAFDGTEFAARSEAVEYEKSVIPGYRSAIRFRCLLPCDNFTVGREYPFSYRYVGFNEDGYIFTVNDLDKEVSLGKSWTEGVIKKRFKILNRNTL